MSGDFASRKYDVEPQTPVGDDKNIPEAVGVYERSEGDGLSLTLVAVIAVILLVVVAAILLLLVI